MSTQDEKKVPYVNDNCIWCWACVAICSNVFDLNDESLHKMVKERILNLDILKNL